MWFLLIEIRRLIEAAMASSNAAAIEAQAAYEDRYNAFDGGPSRLLSIAGDVAELRIVGTITKAPNWMAMMYGGGNVTYREIIAALAEADKNKDVKRLEMRVDSPGGHVDGLFEAVAALQAFSKPIRAIVENTAASAAYALVSQANEIVAVNRAARVGSIGIVASFYVDPNEVDVTSAAAPKKRPDVSTKEGKAVVQEELDALHEIFVEAIAAGRGTTVKNVNSEYGQGATLLADAALSRGMIDAIQGVPRITAPKNKRTKEASTPMNLAELQAQHPEVYAAAVAVGVRQGVEQGAKDERDRVAAHLTLGEASGDMKTALKAVEDGTGLTALVQAKYMAAGLNRKASTMRQEDDAAAGGVVDNATAAPTDSTQEVVNGVLALMGVTPK